MKRSFWSRKNVIIRRMAGVLGFLSAAIAPVVKVDLNVMPDNFPYTKAVLAWAQESAWFVTLFFGFLAGLMRWGATFIKSPRIENTVHRCLDQLRLAVFGHQSNELDERVTLFEKKGEWLHMYQRSGEVFPKKPVKFHIGDKRLDIEGIAGKVWADGRVCAVRDLPDPRDAAMTRSDKAEYCQKSCISEPWFERERPKSRSLCGIPVEVAGCRWGVLVFDSACPRGVPKNTPASSAMPFLSILDRLLSEEKKQ